MRILAMAVSLFCLLAVCAAPASAHSTKGRVKAPLSKAEPGINDVAYFIESYVHRSLYSEAAGGRQERYYVKDFISINREGNRARIDFTVLDKKENRSFPETMTIERGADGVWIYRPESGGTPVEVFTFVKKGAITPREEKAALSITGFLAAAGLVLVIRNRRKKKSALCETTGD
jgi:hypothetical protein